MKKPKKKPKKKVNRTSSVASQLEQLRQEVAVLRNDVRGVQLNMAVMVLHHPGSTNQDRMTAAAEIRKATGLPPIH